MSRINIPNCALWCNMTNSAWWNFLCVRVCSTFFLWLLFFPVLYREWPCIKRRLKIDLLVQVQGSHFWLGKDKQPAQEDLIRAMFNQPQQGRQVLPSEFKKKNKQKKRPAFKAYFCYIWRHFRKFSQLIFCLFYVDI